LTPPIPLLSLYQPRTRTNRSVPCTRLEPILDGTLRERIPRRADTSAATLFRPDPKLSVTDLSPLVMSHLSSLYQSKKHHPGQVTSGSRDLSVCIFYQLYILALKQIQIMCVLLWLNYKGKEGDLKMPPRSGSRCQRMKSRFGNASPGSGGRKGFPCRSRIRSTYVSDPVK
jgi:hypothetical protein